MPDGQETLVDQDFNDADAESLEPSVVTHSGVDLPHDKYDSSLVI